MQKGQKQLLLLLNENPVYCLAVHLNKFLASPIEELSSGFLEKGLTKGKELSVPFHFQEHFQDTEAVALQLAFECSPGEKRSFLVLPWVFYRSRVFLNRHFLGEREGYFYPHVFEVTQQIRSHNDLLIEVLCYRERALHAKEQVLGVFGHWDCKQPHLQPGGIAGNVQMIFKPLTLLRRVLLLPRKRKGGYALELEVVIDSQSCEEGHLSLELTPSNFRGSGRRWEKTISFPKGISRHKFIIHLGPVAQWFPYELGFPHLYKARICLASSAGRDEAIRTIGFRQIKARQNQLLINGIPLFLRGSNLAPLSFHLKDVQRQDYERILQDALQANLNVLRVHAHVEKDLFYELCDQKGMLLFQDFALQWGYHRKIHREAIRQVRKMFFKLHHHPSIYLFCCHNEPFVVTASDPEDASPGAVAKTLFSVFVYNNNKDILDAKLQKALERFQPPQIILRASGLFRTPFHGPTDAHIYCGWYLWKKEHLRFFLWLFPYFKRFITEFGAQAFPPLETLREWGIEKLDRSYLKKYYLLQPKLMEKYVKTRGCSLEEAVLRSQRYQEEVIRHYVEHYRLMKYKPCMGYIHFVLNDGCPGITWSVIDVRGRKKKGYEALAQVSAPLYPILKWRRRFGRIRGQWTIVNDRKQKLEALKAQTKIEQSGRVATRTEIVNLKPDSLLKLKPFEIRVSSRPLTISLFLWHNGSVLAQNNITIGGHDGSSKEEAL